MARYNLIMKDATYVALLGIGGERGMTLGKLLNEILNDYVATYGGEDSPLRRQDDIVDMLIPVLLERAEKLGGEIPFKYIVSSLSDDLEGGKIEAVAKRIVRKLKESGVGVVY